MTRSKKTLIAQHLIEGQFPVMWYRDGKTHVITYGMQTDRAEGTAYAARLFAMAVHHQVECDGRLDP